MRWPWQRKEEQPSEALTAAKEQYEHVRELTTQAMESAERHRILRQHNHFADAVGRAFRESR